MYISKEAHRPFLLSPFVVDSQVYHIVYSVPMLTQLQVYIVYSVPMLTPLQTYHIVNSVPMLTQLPSL